MRDLGRREFNTGLAASAALTLVPRVIHAGEVIDDVSRLNATGIDSVVRVSSVDSVRAALERAADGKQRVATAGARHSQGGHIAYAGGVTLDMRAFKRVVRVDAVRKTALVEAGATWDDVQRAANPLGLAVAVQQSSNIFTVGGSIAVNCHGRDPRYGCVVETLREVTLMLADGRVVKASRTENPELFAATVGGYGLTGVLLEAEIALEDDGWLDKRVTALALDEYGPWLMERVLAPPASQPTVELHFARPSVRSRDMLERVIIVDYLRAAGQAAPRRSLRPERHIALNKAVMALSRTGETGKAIRWYLQESFADRPGSRQRISRNNAMRPEVRFLDYRARGNTDILQEYFVPLGEFAGLMRALKRVVPRHRINLLSVTLRTLRRDDVTLLGYARGDMIAIVLYINVPRSESGVRESTVWTRELVDLTLAAGGTYYLPYQRWPTREQFAACYPRAAEFIAVKKQWDADRRFNSRWAAQYLDT